MYKLLKKIAFFIVPRQFILKHEIRFRSLFAFCYRGNEHECTICNHTFKKFIALDDGDLLCPFCGSRSRTRRLLDILQKESLINGSILHFSPSRSLYRYLSKREDIQYFSTDFENEFIAQYNYDITKIDCPDDSIDLILCYHILEHIEQDEKAMRELYRVLKPGGVCIIQTPFIEGETIYEDSSKTTQEERLEYFGQEDHVRVYSVPGLIHRLEENHHEMVERRNYNEELKYGLTPETVIFTKKKMTNAKPI